MVAGVDQGGLDRPSTCPLQLARALSAGSTRAHLSRSASRWSARRRRYSDSSAAARAPT
jgi:hypothetical protein